jgi:hypothetical protein
VASMLWQNRGGREHHLALVVEHGAAAAQPGWQIHPGGCCNTDIRSLELFLSGEAISASPLPQPLDLRLHINLRGRLTDERPFSALPATGVDAAFASGSLPRAQLRAKLRRLPAGVVATAVVELRRGETVATFYRLLSRHRIVYPDSSAIPVYLQPNTGGQNTAGLHGFARRVSWPDPALAGFQDWVKQLHPSDDGLLRDLRLPPVASLRAIATTPRIYGFVLPQAPPRQLLAFLNDPAVNTVLVGDIAYNLSPSP